MGQHKTERTRTTTSIFSKDVMAVISHHSENEQIRSALALNHLSFGTSEHQTNRILSKLAQYAYQGNVARVESLLNIRPDLRTEALFTLAGLGAQDEMEIILRKHPEDLLVVHPLRDISGAVFEPTTLLKHTLWTKDVFYMANMMLDCLPQNAQGEAIRLKLVRQYEEHMAKGVVYKLKEVKHEDERHFSVQPLIIGLRTFLENYNHWTEEQREKHWCTVVGLAQALIPAHIRHHYCDPEEAFWNNPNFNKPKLKRSLEIYNWILKKSQLWSEGLVGLGRDFGVCGSDGGPVAGSPGDGPWGWLAWGAANLAALTALDGTRTNIDLQAFIERLHTPILKQEDDLGIQRMEF